MHRVLVSKYITSHIYCHDFCSSEIHSLPSHSCGYQYGAFLISCFVLFFSPGSIHPFTSSFLSCFHRLPLGSVSENESVKLVSSSEHVITTLARWRWRRSQMGCEVFHLGCQTARCKKSKSVSSSLNLFSWMPAQPVVGSFGVTCFPPLMHLHVILVGKLALLTRIYMERMYLSSVLKENNKSVPECKILTLLFY